MGDGTDFEALRELFKPHIDSFDYFIDEGLEKIIMNIQPVKIYNPSEDCTLRIWFEKPELGFPQWDGGRKKSVKRTKILPFECRQGGLTYRGKFFINVCLQWNEKSAMGPVIRERFSFGHIPIMLKSKLCHLRNADPQELVLHKEEMTEMGGYFICNGMERLFRLLIMPKRNYPMAFVRNAYRKRGDGYTDKAVVIRCVREDQSAVTVKLFYLQNGSARVGFLMRGKEYLLPVGIVLKVLT